MVAILEESAELAQSPLRDDPGERRPVGLGEGADDHSRRRLDIRSGVERLGENDHMPAAYHAVNGAGRQRVPYSADPFEPERQPGIARKGPAILDVFENFRGKSHLACGSSARGSCSGRYRHCIHDTTFTRLMVPSSRHSAAEDTVFWAAALSGAVIIQLRRRPCSRAC